ncbi:MAG: hypothetical protein FK733_17525 [Asgard group archaeon]|nr:hypothetical protein [Asgard group archaeon]
MEKDDYIPLFILQNDPIMIYIIDNQLFGCQQYGFWGYYGLEKSYNVLLELYTKCKTELALPKTLITHFETMEPKSIEAIFDFVIGGKGYLDNYYLDFQLDYNVTTNQVILDQFVFNDHPLTYQVKTSPNEAFLILSNHLVNCRRNAIAFDYETKEFKIVHVVDKSDIKQANQYVVDYFTHILSKIESGQINPFKLLQLNGAGLLEHISKIPAVQEFYVEMMHELIYYKKLSFNKKLLYYSMISLLNNHLYIEDASVVVDYFMREKEIKKKLKTFVLKPFPSYYTD